MVGRNGQEMKSKKKKSRVLAVMAHPDDSEILIGGTLLQLASRGWEIGLITMTAGDCGSNKTRTKEQISRIRYEEAKSAADSIDAWYECAGEMDLEVFFNKETVRRMVELIRKFKPDIVITHSPSDYLLDHEETSRIVRSAVFTAGVPLYQTNETPPAKPLLSMPALYYADSIEGIDTFGKRVYPEFYIDISNKIEGKRQLLGKHVSQREWLRDYHGIDEYLNRMTEWAAEYGCECGMDYAEGYRQHLGHGYPHEPLLQNALKPFLHEQAM